MPFLPPVCILYIQNLLHHFHLLLAVPTKLHRHRRLEILVRRRRFGHHGHRNIQEQWMANRRRRETLTPNDKTKDLLVL
jgi:hypothetical protein